MNIKINDKVFDQFPRLESERLIFRDFKSGDAKDLFLMRSDDNVMHYMDSYKDKTIQDSEVLINEIHKLFEEKSGITWAIIEKSTDALIGYFGFLRLFREHCRAEIGYALKPEIWGKGYMAESLSTLILFGFNNLQVHSIEANVNPKNTKSMKLLEKAGFKKEAYFRENYLFNGKFIDSVIYALLETDS